MWLKSSFGVTIMWTCIKCATRALQNVRLRSHPSLFLVRLSKKFSSSLGWQDGKYRLHRRRNQHEEAIYLKWSYFLKQEVRQRRQGHGYGISNRAAGHTKLVPSNARGGWRGDDHTKFFTSSLVFYDDPNGEPMTLDAQVETHEVNRPAKRGMWYMAY
jgi:hypothetical protein